MYQRALKGYEKAWNPKHTSTPDTVNSLGALYADQGKIAEAEKMYERALKGYEKAWGLEHTSTLDTVNNLDALYADQGKMAKAASDVDETVRVTSTTSGFCPTGSNAPACEDSTCLGDDNIAICTSSGTLSGCSCASLVTPFFYTGNALWLAAQQTLLSAIIKMGPVYQRARQSAPNLWTISPNQSRTDSP